jgi:glycosyltransferase involved in cell wall biosynthesis
LILWGTYDTGKPRVRILVRGLRESGVEVQECHVDVWSDVEDKSQLRGFMATLSRAWRWISAYPPLIGCLLRMPRHQTLLVPYLGHVDVLVLWPFAKMRGDRIVWDAFLSLYNTIVEDRRLLTHRNPAALGIYALEWLATRAVDRIVLDTSAHAEYFARRFRVSRTKLDSVFVGVEQDRFVSAPPLTPKRREEPLSILFYGQFIPLHGIPTIIRAARQIDDGTVSWTLIGSGQEEATVRRLLAEQPIQHLTWIPWVAYDDLTDYIAAADVCLGIFGKSDKAALVIPNKVFQVISAGRPLVTRCSPAIAELVPNGTRGIYLVPPDEPAALVTALAAVRRDRSRLVGQSLYQDLRPRISTGGIGKEFCAKFLDAAQSE